MGDSRKYPYPSHGLLTYFNFQISKFQIAVSSPYAIWILKLLTTPAFQICFFISIPLKCLFDPMNSKKEILNFNIFPELFANN